MHRLLLKRRYKSTRLHDVMSHKTENILCRDCRKASRGSNEAPQVFLHSAIATPPSSLAYKLDTPTNIYITVKS